MLSALTVFLKNFIKSFRFSSALQIILNSNRPILLLHKAINARNRANIADSKKLISAGEDCRADAEDGRPLFDGDFVV